VRFPELYLPAEVALRQAAALLANVVKRGAAGLPGEFDDLEDADGWARSYYESWVEGLSLEEYSALEEYKQEGSAA
jgi:hypothetical protein